MDFRFLDEFVAIEFMYTYIGGGGVPYNTDVDGICCKATDEHTKDSTFRETVIIMLC